MRGERSWNPEAANANAVLARRESADVSGAEKPSEALRPSLPDIDGDAGTRRDSGPNHPEAEPSIGSTDDRLLGVLAEALFDRERARKAFYELRSSALYDPEQRQWKGSAPDSGGQRRTARTQLLGVLAEALFDRDAARASLATLKRSPLYDTESGQWHEGIGTESTAEQAPYFADDQLLGVLAEALFDRRAAQGQLAALKASPLYDPDHRRWNQAREGAQILGVLAESLFDRDSAIATLATLRATGRTAQNTASPYYADALVLNLAAGALFAPEPKTHNRAVPYYSAAFPAA